VAVPEIGVFLSTTRIGDPAEALLAVRGLGFRVVQLGKLPDRYYTAEGVQEIVRLLARERLEAVSLCVVFDGESYANVSAVRETVGFLPAQTLAERQRYTERCITAASTLGIPLVTFHVGLLPADPDDLDYRRIEEAVGQVATFAAQKGVTLGLETGQETAEELVTFISRLPVQVGVNFDGANFIAYGEGDPLEALEFLYPRVIGVHLKDYAVPAAPGLLSRPAPMGKGAARADETIDFLYHARFSRPLILETYDNHNPLQTLSEARAYVLDRLSRLAGE
jgi:sugar phosphate isomerase/epimerase